MNKHEQEQKYITYVEDFLDNFGLFPKTSSDLARLIVTIMKTQKDLEKEICDLRKELK